MRPEFLSTGDVSCNGADCHDKSQEDLQSHSRLRGSMNGSDATKDELSCQLAARSFHSSRARNDRLGLDGDSYRLRLISATTLSLCAPVCPRCTLQRLQSRRSRSRSTLNAAFVNPRGTSI